MTDSLILRVVVRFVQPLLLVFAFYLFMAGHNAPGGGFIAGLLAAAAILLRYLALGRHRSHETEGAFTNVIAVGLLVALATATAPLLFGNAFFTQTNGHLALPFGGDFHWSTASLFDLGVFIVVIGNVITVLRAMTDGE
ncbi:MAG: multisubunit Na+/H+ antiporter MnhB subunit [Hyphomicrobiaceae bacterium]|jgi:multisubunit Na+/H+ antiporter MnhB subunit